MSEEDILDLLAAPRFTWSVQSESYAKAGEALLDIHVIGEEFALLSAERRLRRIADIQIGTPSRMPGSVIFYVTIHRSGLDATQARRILTEALGIAPRAFGWSV